MASRRPELLATAAHHAAAAEALEKSIDALLQEVRCPICLESLGENTENTATLPCGHTFHGSCLCKALWEKRCCPLCRLKPPGDMSESDTDDEEEVSRQGVPFTDAMKLAHVAAKTDKRTANMFNTVKKWDKQYKESRKIHFRTKRKLKKLRDVPVEQKVEDYRKKQIDKLQQKASQAAGQTQRITEDAVVCRQADGESGGTHR